MSDLKISAIPVDMVDSIWDDIAPKIEMAIEHSNGELTLSGILRRIKKKDMILLAITKKGVILAGITLEISVFDSGKRVLFLTTVGGSEIDTWLDKVSDAVESIGRDHNCEEIYISGRAAWARKLKRLGYGTIHTVVSKKLEVL